MCRFSYFFLSDSILHSKKLFETIIYTGSFLIDIKGTEGQNKLHGKIQRWTWHLFRRVVARNNRTWQFRLTYNNRLLVHGTRVLLLDWGEKLFTRISTVSLFIEKKKKSRNIKKEKERNNWNNKRWIVDRFEREFSSLFVICSCLSTTGAIGWIEKGGPFRFSFRPGSGKAR